MRSLIIGLVFTLSLMAGSAQAETVRGVASVTDGDTLEIQGKKIRLHGIDAPESAQTCQMPDQSVWPCGRRVAQVVDQAIGGKSVACDVTDTDRYGRFVAVCYINGQSINQWLVREGLAFAYRAYSVDYVLDEDAARAERKGIWVGNVMAPWDYRAIKKGGTPVTNASRVQNNPESANAQAPAQRSDSGGFRSCREARNAGAAPVRAGDPGYSRKLDRDGDGVACE